MPGDFGAWLAQHARGAAPSEAGADVPCGDCSACCSTSHFVHVRPGRDASALAHVPRELLFPAPGHAAPATRARLRRPRPLPAAGRRRPVHHLRAPAADLPHVRLPGLRGGGHRRRPRGDHASRRGAGASRIRRREDPDGLAAVRAAARFIARARGGVPRRRRAGRPGALAVLAVAGATTSSCRRAAPRRAGRAAAAIRTRRAVPVTVAAPGEPSELSGRRLTLP